MADTDRAEAQRRREDARRQRRVAEDDGGSPEPADTAAANGGPEHEPRAALMNAAKAAAAGAALGAAVGAALASRDAPSEDEDGAPRRDAPEAHSRDEAQEEQEPRPEVDEEGQQLEGEAAGEADEPAEAAEPTDEASRAAPPPSEPDAGAPQQGASPNETVDVARRAREQLQALHGREPESVSALERTAQGWSVTIEVVELPRVPDSTDVMASYELLLDEDKNLIRYSRRRRYYRSQADRGEE